MKLVDCYIPMDCQALNSMSNLISRFEYNIEKGDYDRAGVVSAIIKRKLKDLSFSKELIRRVAVVSYEAELNIIIHSLGGKLLFDIYSDKVVISTEDKGPGIADIELALTPGYSTAEEEAQILGFGAGMGLPNMKKNSDIFNIESTYGLGTKISMTVFVKEE